MLKRRLDARSYRACLLAQAKPKKVQVSSGSEPGQGNMMLQYNCDKLDAGCSREGDSKSETFQLQQQRSTGSEAKSQLAKGEATLEQLVPTGPEDPSHNSDMMITVDSAASDGRNTEKVNGEGDYGAHRLEKRSPPRFIEYWVPVGFSHLQLEKYCETLIKHSWFLCAKTRKNVTDGLYDVLTRIKECCDHPYLVDSSLQSFVNERRPVVDFLNTGIEASGKLLLLDKLLQESRGKGLRVAIVFQQSKHSKSHSVELRHLLNDFICGRFGEDSYVQIYRDVDRSKNQAALDLFNDKGSVRFVMLMEKCCCQSRIKLSSVDFIILFNSDWSPINDMKCLRKMSIQPTHDHLKVFRLYSPNSLEEMVLISAKDGTVSDTCLHCPSYNVGHMLLLWGVTYLFSKLEDFHGHYSSIANLTSLSEEKLVLSAKEELFMLLSCPDDNDYSFSIVSKLPEGNSYVSSSINLHGEQDAEARDDDIPPHTIWCSLLEGRNPQWRLLPGSSDVIRRRGEVSSSLSPYAECVDESIRTTSKRTLLSQDKIICKKLRSPKVLGRKVCKSGNPDTGGRANGRSSPRDGCNGSIALQNTCLQKTRELISKQEKQVREFDSRHQDKRSKFAEEHQLELSLINQGCGVGELELNKLEDIYEKKPEEHNYKMDMKSKELEATLLAARIKERQFEDKLISISKSKNDKKHTFALVNDSVLGPQSDNLTKNATDPAVTLLGEAAFSEGKTSEEIEQGERGDSILLRNPGLPDGLMTEKEIQLAESNGGKNAVSTIRVAGLSTSDHDDHLFDPSVTASVTVALTEEQSQDMQPAPNSDERNSHTNSEHCKETMRGITVKKHPLEDTDGEASLVPLCPVSDTTPSGVYCVAVNGSLESGGEDDVGAYVGEALNACVDPSDCGSILSTLNEPQLCELSGQNHLESKLKSSNRNVQHQSSNMGASNRISIRVIDNIAAANEGKTSTVAGSLSVQEPSEFPSSRVGDGSLVNIQSQVGRSTDKDLPVEQLIGSVCPPSTMIRQNSGALCVSNCPTSQIQSHEPDQSDAPLRNSGLGNLPVSEPPLCSDHFQVPLRSLGSVITPILQRPLQSSAGQSQLQEPTASSTTVLESANNYFQDSSFVRSNRPLFDDHDPLADELKRIRKEEEEVIKIHEDKTMQLNCACQKEIEEVRKKYDLLLQKAGAELLEKKVALESICKKVEAHKELAETLKYQHQKSQSESASALQGVIMNTIPEPSLLQQCNMPAPRAEPASLQSTVPTTTPQVVHQLSDLMSMVPLRPHCPSTLHTTRNSQVCYPVRGPVRGLHQHLP